MTLESSLTLFQGERGAEAAKAFSDTDESTCFTLSLWERAGVREIAGGGSFSGFSA